MGKVRAELSLNFFSHLSAQPVTRSASTNLIDVFHAEVASTSPVRCAFRSGSSTQFLEEADRDLKNYGMQSALVAPALEVALLYPATAMQGSDRKKFYQASLILDVDSDEHYNVTFEANLKESSNGEDIQHDSTTAEVFDIDNGWEKASLAVDLSTAALSFPLPGIARGSGTFVVNFYGTPEYVESDVVDWSKRIRSLCRVLGVEAEFKLQQQSFGDTPSRRVATLVALSPSAYGVLRSTQKSLATKTGTKDDWEKLSLVGAEGLAFEDHLKKIAAHIISVAEKFGEVDNNNASRARKLVSGERVFHRKTGSAPGFDNFGAACKVCKHGEDQFVRYTRAPKAEKGMARLYSNFDSSMLYHCGKGLGCGVYAVFAPASLG